MTVSAPIFDLSTLPTLANVPRIGRQPMPEGEKSPLPPLNISSRLARKVEKRRMVELVKGQAAVTAIAALPQPGETVHVRMDGSYDGYEIIAAIADLLAPATIECLYVATLSFNRRVSERLLALIDAGSIRHVTFVSSLMFQGKERATVDWLSHELAKRGGRLINARNHCKLILARTTDGRNLAMEGSQNLRTCACWEQFAICDDAALYQWHQQFLEAM